MIILLIKVKMSNLLLVRNVRGHIYIILFIWYEPWEILDIGGGCNFRVIIYGDSFSLHIVQIGWL